MAPGASQSQVADFSRFGAHLRLAHFSRFDPKSLTLAASTPRWIRPPAGERERTRGLNTQARTVYHIFASPRAAHRGATARAAGEAQILLFLGTEREVAHSACFPQKSCCSSEKRVSVESVSGHKSEMRGHRCESYRPHSAQQFFFFFGVYMGSLFFFAFLRADMICYFARRSISEQNQHSSFASYGGLRAVLYPNRISAQQFCKFYGGLRAVLSPNRISKPPKISRYWGLP